MNDQLLNLIKQSDNQQHTYKPVLYRLKNTTDRLEFDKLIQNSSHLNVFDQLLGQVEEFVRSGNPKKVFKKEELTQAAKSHIGDVLWEEYGVWVYYPWNSRLVHILDEQEFIEVRTTRNQNKITSEERDILARKKIGLIGLSVGQSIAITMAIERLFGEIRLADFDVLELSNLNRIRTGVHNLGLSKVISVAREISEIDPFLKVICFPEGLTENNMNDFFLKDGKIDLLIEECDGLDIKILCRYKARELRIPVVMDMNDRGTLDIERFDLEPDRSILHGLIDHLQPDRIKSLTNEEKIPFILPMLGEETISAKLKASMLEIGNTLTTWPQLASSVALGGAIVADVCRRIALNQISASGRWFVDVEELICDEKIKETLQRDTKKPLLTAQAIKVLLSEYNKKMISYKESVLLDQKTLISLIGSAIMAPSEGNRQPWRWVYEKEKLYLFFEGNNQSRFLDYKGINSFLGLGAASENLILKAHELNLEVHVEPFPLEDNFTLVAVFNFFTKKNIPASCSIEPHNEDELVKYISKRSTNRKPGTSEKINPEILSKIQKVVQTGTGVSIDFLSSDKDKQESADLIAQVEKIGLMNEQIHHDFYSSLRWAGKESLDKKDGIDISEFELSPRELADMKMTKDWLVVKQLINWKAGDVFKKLPSRLISSSSAVGLISISGGNPFDLYMVGRAMEKAWLMATKENIAFQPFAITTSLFNRIINDSTGFTDTAIIEKLKKMRENFISRFSVHTQKNKYLLLFRVFVAEKSKIKSSRMSVDDVLSIHN